MVRQQSLILTTVLISAATTSFALVTPLKTLSTSSRLRSLSPLHLTKDDDVPDVIVIGSGIGGLSCAAILAASNLKVHVLESHYEIGGCAHEFLYREDGTCVPSDRLSPNEAKNVYRFEAGPSLYSGLSQPNSPNPLKHVFQMIGEQPEWITYDVWKGYFPEAPEGFRQSIGAKAFEQTLRNYGGPNAISDWYKLAAALRPITEGITALRPVFTLITQQSSQQNNPSLHSHNTTIFSTKQSFLPYQHNRCDGFAYCSHPTQPWILGHASFSLSHRIIQNSSAREEPNQTIFRILCRIRHNRCIFEKLFEFIMFFTARTPGRGYHFCCDGLHD